MPRVNHRNSCLSANISAALLLGLGGVVGGVQGAALAQTPLPAVATGGIGAPSDVAQSAINALASIAASADNNEALVQAAIAAITNIALQSINTPPLYHQPQSVRLLAPVPAPAPIPAPATPLALEMAEPVIAQNIAQESAAADGATAGVAAGVTDGAADLALSDLAMPEDATVPTVTAPEILAQETLEQEMNAAEAGAAKTEAAEAQVPEALEAESPPTAAAAPARPLPARTENDAIDAALELQVSTLVQDTAEPTAPQVIERQAAEQYATKSQAAEPVNLTALAGSLTETVMKEAHAQPAWAEELALPPVMVDIEPQAPVAALQAEGFAPAPAAEETLNAAQEDGRPGVFVAVAEPSQDTHQASPQPVSSARPARMPMPAPTQPPTTPAAPVPVIPARTQPAAKARDGKQDDEDRNKHVDEGNAGTDKRPANIPANADAAVKPAVIATKSAITNPVTAKPVATPSNGKYRFNTNLLVFPVDLDLYADGDNPLLPGVYRIDVYLNNSWAGKFDVRFANLAPEDRVAQPCFDADMLDALGFDARHYAAQAKARLDAGESICGSLAQIVGGAGSAFNAGEHKLMLTAPQAILARTPRGYVNPKRWDAGITAATLGYSYNVYSSKQGGNFSRGTQTSHYLGLRSSLNLGDWRVRFRSTFNKSARNDLTHRRDSIYAERGVPSLNSRLVIGESATSGHVFDSLSVLGAQLVSDTRMRPDSQNAFVPIIRGIAQSNAKVTVHQRGEQIFEMTVPPGPFIIDDLYPNGSDGDLLVTITEADGTQRTFIETYANLPEMLRPGTMHYSASVGRYRNRLFEEEPVMGMLTGSYGFNNTVTTYGGVMLAAGYHSASVGAGFNLPVGAVSADATWANTRASSPTGNSLSSHGYAFRVGWAKFMPKVDTDVTLAMYRYATQGFFEPAQAFQLRDSFNKGGSRASFSPWGNVRRNQLALRLSHQPKGKWGALSFGASVQDYWNRDGRDLSYHLGWGRSIGSASLGLTINRSRNLGASRWENQYMLTLSLPLGRGTRNPAYINTSATKRRNSVSGQTSVSGTLGERHQVGWSLFASGNQSKNQSLYRSGGGSMSATTAINRMGASVSASSGGSRQTSISTSGAMVAFKGGVILSPELGETIGLVQAKNAVGARVQGVRTSSLNAKGHAVVPHLRPYRENSIHLDPKGLSTDVELGNTSQKVAPTSGAVVLLNYETRQGYAMLVSGKRADGSALPFAAGVLNEDGRNVGYVAQAGQALIRADAPKGALTVRWGPLEDQRCNFDYDLSGEKFAPDGTGFRRVEVICK